MVSLCLGDARNGIDSVVSVVFDLSKFDAKPGDKLDVIVRVRPRPGVVWKDIEVDKAVLVASP